MSVGPGINAGVRTDDVQLSCSDDAKCVFEVPVGRTFDIVASGPLNHRFEWRGCTAQPATNICRVATGRHAVTITVR
jgi:hypothetical protein